MSLQRWKGRPVPWVARWSAEVNNDPLQVGQLPDGSVTLHYADGIEDRDDHGVLWTREGITRGGEPEFGEVSAFRQRAAMRRRLCQVCGEKIESKVIRWLLHPEQIVRQSDGGTITMSPPTCDTCLDLSLTECPSMKRTSAIARVLEYRVWGVVGTVARFGPDGRGQASRAALIEYDRTDLPFSYSQVVAKQQVVEWTKFRMED